MRFSNKYKNCPNTLSFLKQSYARILKFKRPKWKKFQAVLKVKSALSAQFINNLILKVNYKTWEKIKSHYKEGIQSKKGLLNLFDNSLSSGYYKKELLLSKKK